MKPKNKKIRKAIFDILIYILGGALYSIGINCFASPNNIAPGGLTGVGVIINHIFGLPIGVLIIVLNIPLFIIGFKELGKNNNSHRNNVGAYRYNCGIFAGIYREYAARLPLRRHFNGSGTGAGIHEGCYYRRHGYYCKAYKQEV